MTVDHSTIENRLGIAFSTETVPTDTQVDAIVTSTRASFKVKTGSTADDADEYDAEIMLLMSILNLARSYRAMKCFATNVSEGDASYQFSEDALEDFKNDLAEVMASAYPTAGSDSTSFEYGF